MRRSRGCQVHISCRRSPTEVRVSRKARAEPATAADGGTAVVFSSVAQSEVSGRAAPAAERERWTNPHQRGKWCVSQIRMERC
jgi:hypothetical protein